MGISAIFEGNIEPQFTRWIMHFIPDVQFGFIPGCGTDEYGAAVVFVIQSCLEKKGADNKRGEGILISLDVAGAFDRCWWLRLKLSLKQKGMRRKALDLLRSYLFQRFIQVVSNGKTSKKREIFSSVPQGGKLSPPLWDFDISEMHTVVSAEAELFCYADDCGLWYELTEDNREMIIDIVNLDLLKLKQWGIKNKTTFEAKQDLYDCDVKQSRAFRPNWDQF